VAEPRFEVADRVEFLLHVPVLARIDSVADFEIVQALLMAVLDGSPQHEMAQSGTIPGGVVHPYRVVAVTGGTGEVCSRRVIVAVLREDHEPIPRADTVMEGFPALGRPHIAAMHTDMQPAERIPVPDCHILAGHQLGAEAGAGSAKQVTQAWPEVGLDRFQRQPQVDDLGEEQVRAAAVAQDELGQA
jgi:hypothetical protein